VIDGPILRRATLVGLILQCVLAGLGHFYPFVAIHLFLFGRMMISASAGYLYGMAFGRGYAAGALGGAVAGGLCAAPVLAVSVLVGDTPASMIAIGTGITILTGAVGGFFGEMASVMRKLGF
jgi:hypothetical protein